MEVLLTIIVTWLSGNFGVPADQNHPRIAFMEPAAMQVARFELAATRPRSGQPPSAMPVMSTPAVESFYDDTNSTIHLRYGWSSDSPADVSVLVHEMVHHLQNAAGLDYPCPEAREKLAYEAQSMWLERHGRNLEEAFGLDPMTILVRTSCFY